MAEMPEVNPLDALHDAGELVALLQAWQWQTVHAARRAGASWGEIAEATGGTSDQARDAHVAAIERQERCLGSQDLGYREVL